MDLSLSSCERLDRSDPLAAFRDRFDLPDGLIYLDGNSLGPLPRGTPAAVERTVREEWGRHLIDGWNRSWWDAPTRLGARIAPLIGAQADEVIVSDTISINLFKLITYALRLSAGRMVILSEGANFPTDRYIAEGLAGLMPGLTHRVIPADCGTPGDYFTDDVAAAVLSHVNYRTGALYDMDALTRAAEARGVVLIWDLAHSAGALPVELNRCRAALAVGCTYKYLNGGPGSPAFLYVRRDLQGRAAQPLSGWFGHARPFAFTERYEPDTSIRQFLTGTHSALSFAALEASLEIWREVDVAALRQKSLSLTGLFMDLLAPLLAPHGLTLLTPEQRGSQVALTHPTHGYGIVQALIARRVIGDFRAPGLMRFGFAPLYLSYADVWHAANHLREVLERKEYLAPQFNTVRAVT